MRLVNAQDVFRCNALLVTICHGGEYEPLAPTRVARNDRTDRIWLNLVMPDVTNDVALAALQRNHVVVVRDVLLFAHRCVFRKCENLRCRSALMAWRAFTRGSRCIVSTLCCSGEWGWPHTRHGT